MMDTITNSDRLTLIKAIVHIINEEYYLLAEDFQKLGFLTKEQDLQKLVEPLKEDYSNYLNLDIFMQTHIQEICLLLKAEMQIVGI